MAFMDTIGPFIDKGSGQLSSAADMTELSSLMQELTSVTDRTMCLMLIERSNDMAQRLAEPLWPILDTWLAEAKESNNSTMLKNLLKVLSMLPVSFALLVGGRDIPKLVRKLAKKWPNEDVRAMASELFEKYAALIAKNTNSDAGPAVSKPSPASPQSDANRTFRNSFNDGAKVEDWENEWKVYKALDDETPAQIAKKKNVSLKDLLVINVWRLEGLKSNSPLEEGTSVLVPTMGPNDPKNVKKRERSASTSDEPSNRANSKRVRSNSESSAATAAAAAAAGAARRSSVSSATTASKRPVATSPPARTSSAPVVKSPTTLSSQKKVVKPAVPQIRKLSSSGRSGSFGAALAKAKVIRAPPKKVVLPPKVEKVVKPPSAKSKVTTSVSSTAASKQPPLKSASGSSKAKARAEPAKVTAVKKAAVKSGLPVNSKTSTGGGGGPALVARMLGKGPAQLSKKVPATSSGSSKTSTPGASRRRVHFPGQGSTKVYPGESDSKPLDALKLCKIRYIPTRANIAEFSPVRNDDHQREQAHNEFQSAQEQTMHLLKQRQPRTQIAWSAPVPIDLKSIERAFGGWDSVVRRKHAEYPGLAEGLKENVLKSVAHGGEALEAHPCKCGDQAEREKSVAPFVLQPGARLPDNPKEPDTRRDRGELIDPYHKVPLIPTTDTQQVPEVQQQQQAVVAPPLVHAPAPAPAPDASEIDIFANIDQLIADASVVEPLYQQPAPAPAPAPAYAQNDAGAYGYDNRAPAHDRYDQGRGSSASHASSTMPGFASSSQPQQQYDHRPAERGGYGGGYSNSNSSNSNSTASNYDNYGSASRGGGAPPQSRSRNLPPQLLPCSFFNTPGGCSNGNSCKFKHEAGPMTERPPQRQGVCFAFQRGECDRGETCRFKHVRN